MSEKDKLTYDKEKKKLVDPYKQTRDKVEAAAKKKALEALSSKPKKDIDNQVLKTMHERINNAKTDEEAKPLEERLKKYQEMFKK